MRAGDLHQALSFWYPEAFMANRALIEAIEFLLSPFLFSPDDPLTKRRDQGDKMFILPGSLLPVHGKDAEDGQDQRQITQQGILVQGL